AMAVSVLACGLMRTGVRAWKRVDEGNRPLLTAMMAAMAGFVVQDLFSFTAAGYGTLFVTLAALLSAVCPGAAGSPSWLPGPHRQVSPRPGGNRLLLVGIWLVAGVLLWFGVIRPVQADLACWQGMELMAESPGAALTSLEQSVALQPWKPL